MHYVGGNLHGGNTLHTLMENVEQSVKQSLSQK